MQEKLISIQAGLKAPKNQFNNFGNYHYRNVEDILEALKPLLKKEKLVLTVSDSIVEVGGRIYVKATATVSDGDNTMSVDAFARESESRKGMDDSQLTGSTSSYARKYALNGLFLIDDTKDSDSHDNRDSSGDDKPKAASGADVAHELAEQFKAHGIIDSETKTMFIQSVINKDEIKTVLDAKRVLKALKDKADSEAEDEEN